MSRDQVWVKPAKVISDVEGVIVGSSHGGERLAACTAKLAKIYTAEGLLREVKIENPGERLLSSMVANRGDCLLCQNYSHVTKHDYWFKNFEGEGTRVICREYRKGAGFTEKGEKYYIHTDEKTGISSLVVWSAEQPASNLELSNAIAVTEIPGSADSQLRIIMIYFAFGYQAFRVYRPDVLGEQLYTWNFIDGSIHLSKPIELSNLFHFASSPDYSEIAVVDVDEKTDPELSLRIFHRSGDDEGEYVEHSIPAGILPADDPCSFLCYYDFFRLIAVTESGKMLLIHTRSNTCEGELCVEGLKTENLHSSLFITGDHIAMIAFSKEKPTCDIFLVEKSAILSSFDRSGGRYNSL